MPSRKPAKPQTKIENERRNSQRIHKNFILSYFDKANPEQRYELTQMKNIGMGGMCFIASQKFEPYTKIGIELTTPYLAETTYLEGIVLGSHEKVKDMIYETRLKFECLDSQAEFLLVRLIEFFSNGEQASHD